MIPPWSDEDWQGELSLRLYKLLLGSQNCGSTSVIDMISSKIKFFYYLITFNSYKRKIYQMRLYGLVNSMIGKKSYYRPKLDN